MTTPSLSTPHGDRHRATLPGIARKRLALITAALLGAALLQQQACARSLVTLTNLAAVDLRCSLVGVLSDPNDHDKAHFLKLVDSIVRAGHDGVHVALPDGLLPERAYYDAQGQIHETSVRMRRMELVCRSVDDYMTSPWRYTFAATFFNAEDDDKRAWKLRGSRASYAYAKLPRDGAHLQIVLQAQPVATHWTEAGKARYGGLLAEMTMHPAAGLPTEFLDEAWKLRKDKGRAAVKAFLGTEDFPMAAMLQPEFEAAGPRGRLAAVTFDRLPYEQWGIFDDDPHRFGW